MKENGCLLSDPNSHLSIDSVIVKKIHVYVCMYIDMYIYIHTHICSIYILYIYIFFFFAVLYFVSEELSYCVECFF